MPEHHQFVIVTPQGTAARGAYKPDQILVPLGPERGGELQGPP
jgi:hypothetical protein